MYVYSEKKENRKNLMDLSIFPQNGPSSPKNSPIDLSSYPPSLLTGPPQSPVRSQPSSSS